MEIGLINRHQKLMNFKPKFYLQVPLKKLRKPLVLWLLRSGTEVKHSFEVNKKFKETYNLTNIRWKGSALKGAKIRWKLKTCGSMTKYVEKSGSYRNPILNI